MSALEIRQDEKLSLGSQKRKGERQSDGFEVLSNRFVSSGARHLVFWRANFHGFILETGSEAALWRLTYQDHLEGDLESREIMTLLMSVH